MSMESTTIATSGMGPSMSLWVRINKPRTAPLRFRLNRRYVTPTVTLFCKGHERNVKTVEFFNTSFLIVCIHTSILSRPKRTQHHGIPRDRFLSLYRHCKPFHAAQQSASFRSRHLRCRIAKLGLCLYQAPRQHGKDPETRSR
jgi:hypothetical protein